MRNDIDDLLALGVECLTAETLAAERSLLEERFLFDYGLTPERIGPTIRSGALPDDDLCHRWLELERLYELTEVDRPPDEPQQASDAQGGRRERPPS